MPRQAVLNCFLAAAVLLTFCPPALSGTKGLLLHAGNPETPFAQHGVTGTFAALDVHADENVTAFPGRVGQRRVPASTFKIANSLIALETGAVASADEIVPYGGQPQPIKAWEQDMSMRNAIRISNVPVYQELARRVGSECYREWLAQLDCGNRRTGNNVERFWLDGSLPISRLEQVEFPGRLIKGELAASPDNQLTVREMLHLETSDRGSLFGKTGWSTATEPQTGWWVGWVERQDTTIAFALTIDMASRADSDTREALGIY